MHRCGSEVYDSSAYSKHGVSSITVGIISGRGPNTDWKRQFIIKMYELETETEEGKQET